MKKNVIWVPVLAAIGVSAMIVGCGTPSVYKYPDPRRFGEVVGLKTPFDYTDECVILSNRFGKVVITRYAAQVVSYVPAGGQEVFFMPGDRDFSKNREMHGGIPICWPWFNMHGGPMSQQHGFARYSAWKVAEIHQDADLSRARFTLESNEETQKLWPFDFRLTYTVTLSDRLAVSLLTENTADPKTQAGKWFEFTEALHSYFLVGDVSRAVIRGLDGVREDRMSSVAQGEVFKGDLKLAPGEGRVFFNNWPGDYLLFDEANTRTLAISTRGNRDIVLWNCGPCRAKVGNLDVDDYRRFICIEPATPDRAASIKVLPGKRSELMMTVKECR